jgi:D-alanyl-D-alanine carboxypeptidase/D-alanyl-D-alanine-endopeptidase (penicillin-binding protein 4)
MATVTVSGGNGLEQLKSDSANRQIVPILIRMMGEPLSFYYNIMYQMCRLFTALTTLMLVVPSSYALPRSPQDVGQLKSHIEGWKRKHNVDMGISVVRISDGHTLLQNDGDKPMAPASVLKVLTSFTALSELGPDFTFNTVLSTTGKQRGDVLEGPLYLVGGGDPLLVSERMWLFANEIQRLGIRKFTGPLYIDVSLFDPVDQSERMIDGADQRAYNAPLSPLSFNFNTTTIVARPAINGSAATAMIDPPNDFVSLQNELKLVSGSGHSIDSAYLRGSQNGEVYAVRGTIGKSCDEVKLYRALKYPPSYFLSVLRTLLHERGVDFPARYELKKQPAAALALVTFKSLPLPQIIDGLNKHRNNYPLDHTIIC